MKKVVGGGGCGCGCGCCLVSSRLGLWSIRYDE